MIDILTHVYQQVCRTALCRSFILPEAVLESCSRLSSLNSIHAKMASSLCVQDHVVLLLSPQDFDNPPSWLSDNFNILEGGVHAG